jgi:hypothetical protein
VWLAYGVAAALVLSIALWLGIVEFAKGWVL